MERREEPILPLTTDDLVLRICRHAAARALLAGSLVACTRDAAATVQTPREQTTRAHGETAQQETTTESVPRASPSLRQEPVVEDPAVAPPLLTSDKPTLVSTTELSPFPCDFSPPPYSPDDNDYVRARMAAWDRGRFNRPARELHVAHDLDYIEIKQAILRGGTGQFQPDADVELAMFAQAGTPCAGASHQTRCEQSLEQARRELAASFPCSGWTCKDLNSTFALTTHGDEVTVVRSPAEFRALLGEIDSPVEAWLMVMAHRLTPGYQCDSPPWGLHRAIAGGYELTNQQVTQLCRGMEGQPGHRPYINRDYTYRVTTRGNVKRVFEGPPIVIPQCVVSGRRPPGLLASPQQTRSVGALLANMARLELASVTAFRRLARELQALGAPVELCTRARAAARDEIRHARAMTSLARVYGAEPQAVRVEPSPLRDTFALALDNVTEGCVRELFGALMAHVQQERANDPRIAAAFLSIAADEARHAALALDLHLYLSKQLDAEQRALLTSARSEALANLYAELAEPTEDERDLCGMPTLHEAHVLFDTLLMQSPANAAPV